MEIDFTALDYSYLNQEDKNYTLIFGRNHSGKRVCLIDEFKIYFWAILKEKITKPEIEKLIDKLRVLEFEENFKIIDVELEEKKFFGKKIQALKIYTNSHKACSKIAEEIKFKEIDKLRESEINPITKYLLQKKILPLKNYVVEGEAVTDSDFYGISSDLEVDICLKVNNFKESHQKKFSPKVLAFDIETNEIEIGKGEILMISLVSDNFKKVLSCKKSKKSPDYVEIFDTEKEMLEKFIEYYKKLSPDILTGYFSDGFDLPYIVARAKKNKIKLSLGIDNTIPLFSGGKMPRGKITGIVHIDLFKFIKTAYSQYLQSETLGLGDVALELLGDTKKEFKFKPDEKMDNDDWNKFFEYNLHDSILTFNLFNKAWNDLMEFSQIIEEPLFNVSRDGMSMNVENYIIHNLSEYDEIIEQKPEHHEISKRRHREKYEGAFVLQPVPKLYEDIAMFDFTSYWPSIIATFNLSASTFLGDKKKDNSIEVEINSGNRKKNIYFSKQKGFFPEMLEKLIIKRKEYKKEYQKNPSPILKARSNAFKLLANASYGYQGFFGARYYCPEASAATTAISRKFIKQVIEDSNKAGFKAIYSDTDSIALELNNQSKKQSLEFLNKINDKLPGIMELELEDFYKRGIWVTTRKGEFGAKKKYALINEDGKLKVRGFETVRRDWCNLSREMQNIVLEKILKEGNEKSALKHVLSIVKKLRNREIDKNKLIIKTQLKKSLSDYKSVTPHVIMAKKMIAKGLPVNEGMLIEYYIVESSDKKALKRDKTAFPEEDKPYDIIYYLEKQIIPAVENIFMVFGIDISEELKEEKQKKLF